MLWKLSRSPFACFVLNMCDADSSQSWVITLSMSICQSQLINSCQPHLQLSSSIVSTESWKSDKVPWYHIWYQTWIIMDPWFVIMFSICFSMCFPINWPYLGGGTATFPIRWRHVQLPCLRATGQGRRHGEGQCGGHRSPGGREVPENP